MSASFKYDVFLSHSSTDTLAVRELAQRLKSDGLSVWLDEWQIQPGDMISLKIEQGLEQSRTLVLVMSGNAFTSEWVTLERHTAMFRDPTNSQRRFIPLRLDDTEIKEILKQYAYVDWRQRSDEEYARLLARCRPIEELANLSTETKRKPAPIRILKGHKVAVRQVEISSDGRRVASWSNDKVFLVWDVDSGEYRKGGRNILRDINGVHNQSVSVDCQRIVTSRNGKIWHVWDLEREELISTFESESTLSVLTVSPRGQRALFEREETLEVRNLDTGEREMLQKSNVGPFSRAAITQSGQCIIHSGEDQYDKERSWKGSHDLLFWNLDTQGETKVLKGHQGSVRGVAISTDGQRAVSASEDRTVRVWDLATGKCIAKLEGHFKGLSSVAMTPDGRRAVSASDDHTARVWDLDSGRCLAILEGHTGTVWDVAITANGQRVVSASQDRTLRVWDLSPSLQMLGKETNDVIRYTNAKVLLVGDSGVGKSGLALRLVEDRFEPMISTDAVWATQMELPYNAQDDNIEREVWLWDFAGQADYRLIHQLYMDETALAVLVFNPQSENPFEGLGQWDHDLQRASRRAFKKLLVAGRCDRGGLMVSRTTVDSFCKERRFAGYLETSAYTGAGCSELYNAIVDNISWGDIPWTTSPYTFKILKEEIVRLKDEGKVLLRIGELKQQLEMRLPEEFFTLEQLRAVVGLLAGPGIVRQLEFGDFVLLQPERINAYAAAVIRSVRAHIDEIGCILEEQVLAGKLDYQDMRRLPLDEEQIVLRAMHQTFVDYSLCLREHTEAGTLLVFPSYFKRERPSLEEHPTAFVTYRFSGPLDEIYATLVVRLHYTSAFEKDQLWRFAADFKTQAGKRVGFKMTKKHEGMAEITVYLEPSIPDDTKVTFVRYVHDHLREKDPDIIRERHYVCPHCQKPLNDHEAVQDRLERGKKDILCPRCEERFLLWDLIEEKFASEEARRRVQELEGLARINIDNESLELILIGHAFAIAGEAGQIFRPTPNSDWGIDGEIEFKNDEGEASGKRVYLQLKAGDFYLQVRKRDGEEIFTIKNPRHAQYWRAHAYPVMLVIRTSDGQIRWMNMTDYLRHHDTKTRQIVFNGEPFTALNVMRFRERIFR